MAAGMLTAIENGSLGYARDDGVCFHERSEVGLFFLGRRPVVWFSYTLSGRQKIGLLHFSSPVILSVAEGSIQQ